MFARYIADRTANLAITAGDIETDLRRTCAGANADLLSTLHSGWLGSIHDDVTRAVIRLRLRLCSCCRSFVRRDGRVWPHRDLCPDCAARGGRPPASAPTPLPATPGDLQALAEDDLRALGDKLDRGFRPARSPVGAVEMTWDSARFLAAITSDYLPLLRPCWVAMRSMGLGEAPPWPGEPTDADQAERMLRDVIAWCRERVQPPEQSPPSEVTPPGEGAGASAPHVTSGQPTPSINLALWAVGLDATKGTWHVFKKRHGRQQEPWSYWNKLKISKGRQDWLLRRFLEGECTEGKRILELGEVAEAEKSVWKNSRGARPESGGIGGTGLREDDPRFLEQVKNRCMPAFSNIKRAFLEAANCNGADAALFPFDSGLGDDGKGAWVCGVLLGSAVKEDGSYRFEKT
jgi:hypothetical protein